MKGGEVKFIKDGYTDLRGAFDYTSLNTNEPDLVGPDGKDDGEGMRFELLRKDGRWWINSLK